MTAILPRLFFVNLQAQQLHRCSCGQIVGFLIGVVPQTYPNQAYVHFFSVHPARRGEGLGRLLNDRVLCTKDLQSYDAEHWA